MSAPYRKSINPTVLDSDITDERIIQSMAKLSDGDVCDVLCKILDSRTTCYRCRTLLAGDKTYCAQCIAAINHEARQRRKAKAVGA